jgi:hypothetical protein
MKIIGKYNNKNQKTSKKNQTQYFTINRENTPTIIIQI